MFVYTFTTKKHNYGDGEYDFVAKQWADVIEMAINFERKFNIGKNDNYTIEFNINRRLVRKVAVNPGFINIRGRTLHNE